MSKPRQRGANDPLQRAIRKLVIGLRKREQLLRERRQHHRYEFGVKVFICVKSDEGTYRNVCDAWALDMSLGGIGCLTTQEVDAQDDMYASFEDVLGRPCYIPIRVANCKALIGDIWRLHAAFVLPDDPADEVPAAA
jgi:hypothetical protein